MLQWRGNTSLAATIATSASARCAISEAASTTVTVFVRSARNSPEPITAIASAQCVKKRVASTTAIARAGYARCVGKVEATAASGTVEKFEKPKSPSSSYTQPQRPSHDLSAFQSRLPRS
jgi:hypothetical protein